MNKADDSSERFNVLITPNAKVLRTNATLGKNGRCLGQHQPGSAHGAAAQMDEMPVVGVAIMTGVLAHGRDKHTICKLEVSNGERIKKVSHRFLLSKSRLRVNYLFKLGLRFLR